MKPQAQIFQSARLFQTKAKVSICPTTSSITTKEGSLLSDSRITAAVAAGTVGKYQIVVMQLLTICGHDIFFCPVMGSDRCVFSDPYSGGDSQFKESVIQLHPVDLPVGVEELVMYGLAFFKVVENIKILYQRIMDPVQVEAHLTVGLPGLAGHISGAALVSWKTAAGPAPAMITLYFSIFSPLLRLCAF